LLFIFSQVLLRLSRGVCMSVQGVLVHVGRWNFGELTFSSSTLAANGNPSFTRKMVVDLTMCAGRGYGMWV
jgi:hypothetical protein